MKDRESGHLAWLPFLSLPLTNSTTLNKSLCLSLCLSSPICKMELVMPPFPPGLILRPRTWIFRSTLRPVPHINLIYWLIIIAAYCIGKNLDLFAELYTILLVSINWSGNYAKADFPLRCLGSVVYCDAEHIVIVHYLNYRNTQRFAFWSWTPQYQTLFKHTEKTAPTPKDLS